MKIDEYINYFMIENLLFQFICMSIEHSIYNIFININSILAEIKFLNFFHEILFSNLFIDYFFLCYLMKMLSIFRDTTCIVSVKMSFFWFWLLIFFCFRKLILSRDEYFCLISISDNIILVFTIHLLKYEWYFNCWIF